MSFLKKLMGKAKKAFHSLKSKFDKGGSYTGSPDEAGGEKPEQDADDL